MKILFLLSIFLLPLVGDSLKKEISNMLIVGFSGTKLDTNTTLARHIQKYSLGGVILFGKNLQTKKQTKALTQTLQSLHKEPLLIALDQEGGLVDRLGKIEGVAKFPSAKKIAHYSLKEAKKRYAKMAHVAKELGFGLNFAPVVDLAINPKNRVIVGFRRSYGSDPKKVVRYASVFIDAFAKENIICTLKHFPGHGSSMGDSHLGFTDVSATWQEKELRPFLLLIQNHKAKAIMSAHIFNRHLDPDYPATLSYVIIQKLLRQKLGFEGVVISDDMQMGALSKHYTLKERIALAINAGVDMLLFGNQLQKPVSVKRLVGVIETLLKEGRISKAQIQRANQRIDRLKKEFF